MSWTRRGILKMLPSAPLVVQQAQKQAESMLNSSIVHGKDPDEDIYDSLEIGIGRRKEGKLYGKALGRLLRSIGFPEFKKREMRRRARSSRILDPDIAALRSISMSAKVNMQWRRNEKAVFDRAFDSMDFEDDRDEFLRKHNIDWF